MWIVTEDNFFQAFELDIVDDDEENGFFDLFVGTYPRVNSMVAPIFILCMT
jgi:hypothetical protein